MTHAPNVEPVGAREYHERTKHSPESVRASGHVLDWSNQPLPFKIYRSLDRIALSHDFVAPELSALQTLLAATRPRNGEPLDLRGLARLLQLSAGITRTKTYPGGEQHYFRAAACTGALYHIDVYAVCGAVADLPAGVYHFGPHDFALRRLRPGDHRATIAEATGKHPAFGAATAVLVCTSTFWRNAWKYQSRAYRHCFWDCGTLVANLLAAARSQGTPVDLAVGFADTPANHLLGLDTGREVALALVALGSGTVAPPVEHLNLPALSLQTEPLSAVEVDYPLIRATHAGTGFATGVEARSFRDRSHWRPLPEPRGELVPLPPSPPPTPETIDAVIRRRGSTRRFAQTSLSFPELAAAIRAASIAIPADFLPHGDTPTPGNDVDSHLCDLYLIANDVAGLAPGSYVYRPVRNALERLSQGDWREAAGFLALGQNLAADASANLYLLCDLDAIVARFGERGYRAAQLEGGIRGGAAYLAAYAQRFGATGLTFFDDRVTEFFSPHARGKSVMFLVALGRARRM